MEYFNLRSTRRTELEERFANHVVNAWLGHSGAVAAKHYLQVTDEHWERTVGAGAPTPDPDVQKHGGIDESRAPIGAPIDGDPSPSGSITDTKKPRGSRGLDGCRWPAMAHEVTPTGLEPVLPP